MKTTITILFILLCSVVFGQEKKAEVIVNHWVKEKRALVIYTDRNFDVDSLTLIVKDGVPITYMDFVKIQEADIESVAFLKESEIQTTFCKRFSGMLLITTKRKLAV